MENPMELIKFDPLQFLDPEFLVGGRHLNNFNFYGEPYGINQI